MRGISVSPAPGPLQHLPISQLLPGLPSNCLKYMYAHMYYVSWFFEEKALEKVGRDGEELLAPLAPKAESGLREG